MRSESARIAAGLDEATARKPRVREREAMKESRSSGKASEDADNCVKTCSLRTNVSENAFSIAASKVVVALSIAIFKTRFDFAAEVVFCPRRILEASLSVTFARDLERKGKEGTRRWLIETLAKVRADRRQELGKVVDEERARRSERDHGGGG